MNWAIDPKEWLYQKLADEIFFLVFYMASFHWGVNFHTELRRKPGFLCFYTACALERFKTEG